MRNFVIKYEIWIFLILAPIVNTLMAYARTEGLTPGFIYTHGRFYALLLTLIFIVKYTKGNEGIKDMFKPMLNWKVNLKWYFFSLIFAASIGAIALLYRSFYDGSEFSSLFKLNFAATSPKRAFVILTWAFLGEVVWVSYCVRELSKKMNLFYASQIVGFFWTLWWIPAVYLGEGVLPNFPVLILLIGMMGTAGMCAVVYRQTKSGICVLILQFMLNMSLIILPISPKVGGIPVYTTFVIIYFVVMLGFMFFLNPKKSFNNRVPTT
ncbi:hypothetical protein FBALC1_11327 [Flavobacteriales bacterium ALC-1]|nr:hypothetical protein FBALC1_11327 [Flavobacteriales bacterium ALC-1]